MGLFQEDRQTIQNLLVRLVPGLREYVLALVEMNANDSGHVGLLDDHFPDFGLGAAVLRFVGTSVIGR